MRPIFIIFAILIAAVTFHGHATERKAVPAFELLFGPRPARSGVEKLLIEGFARKPILNPDVEVKGFHNIGTPTESELDEFFSRHFLQGEPHFYDPFGSTDRDVADYRAKAKSRLSKDAGALPPWEKRFYEALIWLHDGFESHWTERMNRDPFYIRIHEQILAIARAMLDPPRFNQSTEKLSNAEIERRATVIAAGRVFEKFGIDPRSKPDDIAAGLREIHERLSEIGGPEADRARIFRIRYGFDPDHPSREDLALFGRRRHENLKFAFVRALAQERLRLEDERRVVKAQDTEGEPVKIDRKAQLRRLRETLLAHFAERLPGGKIKFTPQTPPYPLRVVTEDYYGPVTYSGAHLHYFANSEERDVILKAQDEKLPQDDTYEKRVLQFRHEQLEREFAKRELNRLRPGSDIFIEYDHANFYDYLFQPTNIDAQTAAHLHEMLQTLQITAMVLEHRPEISDNERRRLRTMIDQGPAFSASIYSSWFTSYFPRVVANYRSGFTSFQIFRMLGVWGISQGRDFFGARDRSAAAAFAPDAVKDFNEVSAIFKTRERYQDYLVRIKYDPRYKRDRLPEPAKTGVEPGDAGPAQPSERASLTVTLSRTTGAARWTKAPEEWKGNEPVLVTADHWLPGRINLFTTAIISTAPAAPLSAPANRLRQIHVAMLQPLTPGPGGLIPILTPVLSEMNDLEILNADGTSAASELRRSRIDGGYVVKVDASLGPLTYRASFNSQPAPLELKLSSEQSARLRVRAREVGALAFARALEGEDSLTVEKAIAAFAASSIYAAHSDRDHALGRLDPMDYRAFFTRDGYFVGNCDTGNGFLEALLKELGIQIETRTVVAMDSREYRAGDDLHAILFMPGRWLDGTPLMGPLEQAGDPSQSTAAEMLSSRANDTVSRITERIRTWWSNFRRKEAVAQPVPAPKVEENKTGPPAPAMPPPAAKPAAPNSSEAGAPASTPDFTALKKHLTEFMIVRAKSLEQAREAGLERIRDYTHPAWVAGRISGAILLFMRGEHDFAQTLDYLNKNFGINRSQPSPLHYVEDMRRQLDRSMSHIAGARRLQPNADELKILTAAEALIVETQKILTDPALKHWPQAFGLLKTCESVLKP